MMAALAVGVCAVFAAISLGLVIYLIGQLIKAKDQQISDLTATRDRLQGELENLINRKRQTGPTIAGLEDMAAQLTNLKLNRQIEDVIIDACLNTAGQLRQGPYNYNSEKPSGPREQYK